MDNEKEKGHNDLEIDNLPNRLTIFRMLLIPVVIGALFLASPSFFLPEKIKISMGWLAAWIFAAASFTDFLDGYIARKKNIITVFGSFLDPIVDKFLTVSSLIMLGYLGRVHVLIIIILVLREMYVTSLRLLAMNEGVSVPVNRWGKWKTATQMVAIPMLMANEEWQGIDFSLLGTILIFIASFLSLWSASNYSLGLIKKLKEKRLAKRKKDKNKKAHTDES